MSATRQTISYTAQRVILTSSKPLKAVLAALNHELNMERAGMALMQTLASAKTRDDLERGITALTEGKRDFLLFAAGSHAQWMDAYYGGKQKFGETIVFTLGNPLIAKEILRHDMAAGLNVPPKILVQETENGGTRILYDLPSSIMGSGMPSAELKAALEDLDEKLERMVKKVLSSSKL